MSNPVLDAFCGIQRELDRKRTEFVGMIQSTAQREINNVQRELQTRSSEMARNLDAFRNHVHTELSRAVSTFESARDLIGYNLQAILRSAVQPSSSAVPSFAVRSLTSSRASYSLLSLIPPRSTLSFNTGGSWPARRRLPAAGAGRPCPAPLGDRVSPARHHRLHPGGRQCCFHPDHR